MVGKKEMKKKDIFGIVPEGGLWEELREERRREMKMEEL